MDTLYLYRLGKSVQNVYHMLQDRGFRVDETIFKLEPLVLASNIYEKARTNQMSLGESIHETFAQKDQSSSNVCHVWCLDRNFDILRNRERMISTDQIKTLMDLIYATDPNIEQSHIIMSPNKLSPQAKKEVHERLNIFLFDELLIDLPRHELVLAHKVVTEDTLKEYLGTHMNKFDLPVLPIYDPVARWYDFPKDSIIFIDNPVIPSFRIVQ